jgi:hypothetical protein
MDLPAVLNKLYPNVAGWETVNNKITKVPKGLKKPTQQEMEDAWAEIQSEREEKRIIQERKDRYEKETDSLLFDALAETNIPELAEWKQKRQAIKDELPKPEKGGKVIK